MNILLIDNYDSFTYNLVHYLEDLGATVTVKRNDQFDLDELKIYDKVVLSPGPGIPSEAGLLLPAIKRLIELKKPIFGVCLGQQAIVEVLGGTIINMDKVYHGIATPMKQLLDSPIFKGVDTTFEAGRYHSWVAQSSNFPEVLEVTAVEENNQIMAIQHKELPIYAVQFHPESIMTPDGKKMLKNFLELT